MGPAEHAMQCKDLAAALLGMLKFSMHQMILSKRKGYGVNDCCSLDITTAKGIGASMLAITGY